MANKSKSKQKPKIVEKQENQVIARIEVKSETSYVNGNKETGQFKKITPVILRMPEKEYNERLEKAILYMKTGSIELP